MFNQSTEYTKEEIVEIVKMIRLELYNNGLFCGAKAIKNKIEEKDIEPIPVKKRSVIPEIPPKIPN